MASTERPSVSAVVTACRRLAVLGFVPASDGNVSVRFDARTILITRSGCSLGDIKAPDVVRTKLGAQPARPRVKPSSELPVHAALYSHNSEIRAVVHAHPPHATAFAASGTRLTPNVFPEVALDLGDVPLVRYAMPSSPELASMVARHAGTSNAVLLANHGAVTWGRTLGEAVRRMEKLEHSATVELYARLLGGVRQLSHEQIAALRSRHPLSPWGQT